MRKLSPCSACTASAHRAASWLATTNAVGWPRATSAAKLGPDSTPARAPGQTACATSWPSQPLPCWKPLHSQSTPCSPPPATASISAKAAIGVATTTSPPQAWLIA